MRTVVPVSRADETTYRLVSRSISLRPKPFASIARASANPEPKSVTITINSSPECSTTTSTMSSGPWNGGYACSAAFVTASPVQRTTASTTASAAPASVAASPTALRTDRALSRVAGDDVARHVVKVMPGGFPSGRAGNSGGPVFQLLRDGLDQEDDAVPGA